MVSRAAFKVALVWIGFNTLTADEIIENGFDEISVLSEVEDKYINKLIRHIGRWRDHEQTRMTRWVCSWTLSHSISLYLFL